MHAECHWKLQLPVADAADAGHGEIAAERLSTSGRLRPSNDLKPRMLELQWEAASVLKRKVGKPWPAGNKDSQPGRVRHMKMLQQGRQKRQRLARHDTDLRIPGN